MRKGFYVAPNRRGLMIKVVEDVRVPVSPKLCQLGEMSEPYIIRQRLVARFVNEAECAAFMQAYNKCNSQTTDDPGVVHVTGLEAKENGENAYKIGVDS